MFRFVCLCLSILKYRYLKNSIIRVSLRKQKYIQKAINIIPIFNKKN